MAEDKRHPFVVVRVRPAELELAQLRLWELGAAGLEERDETTIVREPVEGKTVVIAAFEDEAAARHALAEVCTDYEADLLLTPFRDWATEWRRGFSAQRIGRRILLHPSWEPVQCGPSDVVITIDPENAFGSGDHETTRLVLGILDERIRGGERILDVGCGSGILSIAALRLGAESSVAIDIEADAVAVALRNAALNDVASCIDVSTTPLSEVEGRYDLVLANIETRVLLEMPRALEARLSPGAMLVLSGILRREKREVLAAYVSVQLVEVLEEGEWCACVFERVSP